MIFCYLTVIHDARITQRSPGGGNEPPTNLVIYNLVTAHKGDRIGPTFAIDLYPDDLHAGIYAGGIGFGDADGRNMVMILLVDDGVPDRGHRKKMLSGQYAQVGIACGEHKVYRHMCVIDFAEKYEEMVATSPDTDP